MVTVTQLCEYVQNHKIEDFKWMNCMVCGLHLNKSIILKIKATQMTLPSAKFGDQIATPASGRNTEDLSLGTKTHVLSPEILIQLRLEHQILKFPHIVSHITLTGPVRLRISGTE